MFTGSLDLRQMNAKKKFRAPYDPITNMYEREKKVQPGAQTVSHVFLPWPVYSDQMRFIGCAYIGHTPNAIRFFSLQLAFWP